MIRRNLTRSSNAWLLRGAAALLVLLGLAGGSWVLASARRAETPRAVVGGVLHGDAPSAPGFTSTLIESLQERLRLAPDDAASYGLLGAAYLQRARETGDPAFYLKAEAVLAEALARRPDDAETLTTLGALALAQHQFDAGLAHGQRALDLNPYSTRALGVIADAQVELGQYAAAVETVQRMVDTRPDMASYARVSYLRELHGDVPGALEAMQAAAQAGSGVPEHRAWTLTQLGLLRANHGDPAGARAEFEAALRAMPGYVPAQAGLARVLAAEGRLEAAIAAYEAVTERMPLAEYVIALGDCYLAAGRRDEASRQYALVEALAHLQQANGVDVDLEITLFEADHPGEFAPLETTVARARQVYARRPTVQAADVLAWALYQTGELDEAERYAAEALALNTQDASAWYHAGAIAWASGDTPTAQARLAQSLLINPHFSLRGAAEAERMLAQLAAQ
jgi:tetratricopeptide (TPR) repeat protein